MTNTSLPDQQSSASIPRPTRRQRIWRTAAGVALMVASSWAFYAWSSDSGSGRSGSPGVNQSSLLHTVPDSAAEGGTDQVGAIDAATEPNPDNRSPEGGTGDDARFRRMIVGRWEQDSRQRYLTVREDGTATLVAEPEGVWSYLLGDRLHFEIEWSIEDGCAVFHVTEGRPEAKAEIALNTWGREWNQVIEKLTPERLVLIGENGEDRRAWSRTGTAGQSE